MLVLPITRKQKIKLKPKVRPFLRKRILRKKFLKVRRAKKKDTCSTREQKKIYTKKSIFTPI